jgi:6-pyruvoyl-tetrahydropterin synthase
MYAVEVRDHMMIAHSLPGEVFGPAQALHGATFVVDVAFFRETLTSDSIVVDIGRASEVLRRILSRLNYANLDALPQLAGKLTTTEFLARYVYDRVREACHGGDLGVGAEGIERIRVTLHESHVARAWYEGPVGNG